MGLRFRLLLLVLLPTVPALILASYTSLEQRQLGRSRVEKDALRIVQLAAEKELGVIEATRQHFLALSRMRDEARGTNAAGFQSFFKRLRNLYADYTDFGLIETNGDLVACSYPNQGPTNLAQHAFFQSVLRTGELSVGGFEPTPPGAKPSLDFGYPLRDEAGKIFRVLYASLDLAVLDRALSKMPLPDSAMISILDANGLILAHAPNSDQWKGKPFATPSVLALIKAKKENTAEVKPWDGVVRLCAFTPLSTGTEVELFVAAGIPLSMAYRQTRQMLLLNFTILGGVAALALLAAWFYADRYILRPVHALTETTRQVTAGNLAARTGVAAVSGELSNLAQAFDQMTDSLQEQRRQNAALQAELEDRVKDRTAQLERSNKELEAFSYSVSHDLRAPLRHIHGHVNILLDQAGDSLTAEDRRLLKLISEAAKRMGLLIDSLLDFSRMGRVELTRAAVDQDALVREVVGELNRDIEGRAIEWSIAPLPPVSADRALLKQVWANLLSNAVKYSRDRTPAKITITGAVEAEEIIFRIEDNGAGFDMRYADKLFRVFERLHRPEQFEGTGIGLANVRRIIQRHGGRTWAEGKPNGGAVFYFALPCRPGSREK